MLRSMTLFLGVLLVVFTGVPAHAQPPPQTPQTVHVLAVSSDDALPQAQALTTALKQAVTQSGWSLGEGDHALEVLTAALACKDPPDAACLTKIGDKIKSSRFVWGILKKDKAEVVASLHLWEGGAAKKDAEARFGATTTDPKDAKLAAAAVLNLLNGQEPNPTPVVVNTCYSFVNDTQVIHVASVHQYNTAKKVLEVVQGSGGVSKEASEQEGKYAWAWAQNIWADMLG